MTGPYPAPAQWPGGTPKGSLVSTSTLGTLLGQGWLQALGFGFQHGASSLSIWAETPNISSEGGSTPHMAVGEDGEKTGKRKRAAPAGGGTFTAAEFLQSQ